MPIPLGDLVAVAEYGSKFEADVVVNLLIDNGIQATTSYDPALNSVATYFASDRTVDVVVRPGDVERARQVISDADRGLPDAFDAPEVATWHEDAVVRRDRGRRTIVRVIALGLALILVLPILIALVSFLRG